jgi:hypothetical protein
MCKISDSEASIEKKENFFQLHIAGFQGVTKWPTLMIMKEKETMWTLDLRNRANQISKQGPQVLRTIDTGQKGGSQDRDPSN